MIVLAFAALSGCAAETYWQRTQAPVLPVVLVEHDDRNEMLALYYVMHGRALMREQRLGGFAARTDYGCFIHIMRGDECALRHERAHCAGWNHDDRTAFTEDCGPGGYE